MSLELIQIFFIFGPPSILQADNGKEFSHGASKSGDVQLDEEVSHFVHSIVGQSQRFSTHYQFGSSALEPSMK
jgi:hypothetical protein